MNRSAYFTTGLAIKLLSRLSKASIVLHGKENIPTGPTIFVVNHFTRVETFLLPAYIYNLTGKPVLSLAASSLFKGGLAKFLRLVGTVSTADPKRDELIVKSLLIGEANWVIFPEGNMVKTKKIMDGGKFMIASSRGMHEPHTGAASLALRAELYRTILLDTAKNTPSKLRKLLDILGLKDIADIQQEPITIQPVNLTYYPIRAAENMASSIASKLVRDISENMVEEIMAEGTMLLSGVDLDIRCGKPIMIADYIDEQWLHDDIDGFFMSLELKEKMRKTAYDLMQRYMQDIYALTTVNQEHLFASFLRMYPFKRIDELDFKRRVFYAISIIRGEEEAKPLYLHKSLKGSQAHLLTEDRSTLSVPLSFHKGRITNPIEIMANEVEPLINFRTTLKSLSRQPEFLLRLFLIRHLLRQENLQYAEDVKQYSHVKEKAKNSSGKPFLLPYPRRKMGVVLIHSYLAEPEEVKALAKYLRRQGIWVYAPRLPGHGTSAEDLAGRKYHEWVETVETGYILMSMICDRIVVGGVAVGGSLALDLAARVGEVAGVFAICPPLALRNYSTKFMPAQDVWNRILNKTMRGEQNSRFFEFTHGNVHLNYPKNPVAGVKEVGDFLDSISKSYIAIKQPALIIQADNNPVVDPKGSLQLYDNIASSDKEFCLLSYDRHILVNGEGAEKVFKKIGAFIGNL
jgi:esterase/lipase/1-acyl-sn-glycerol-3-phosphate acyltransferase